MAQDIRARYSAPLRRAIVAAAAVLGLTTWGAEPARAQLACGDAIPPGGSVKLDGDLGPCDLPGPALTIEGPVKVNLNNFKVSCAADITGILVTGVNARLENGIIKNCKDGVEVAGAGRHRISKVEVRTTRGTVGQRGFRVRSDDNYLARNRAGRFNGEGFRIEGGDNRLFRNKAEGNKNHGFRVDGDQNILIKNLSEDNGTKANGGEGFRIDGKRNRVLRNTARANQDEGFRIRDGQDNTLLGNSAEGNGTSDNEAGLRVQGSGNVIRANTSKRNLGDGILVTEEASNNEIRQNIARGNGGTDLVDETLDPPCDDNRWTKNLFDTKSQDCIR